MTINKLFLFSISCWLIKCPTQEIVNKGDIRNIFIQAKYPNIDQKHLTDEQEAALQRLLDKNSEIMRELYGTDDPAELTNEQRTSFIKTFCLIDQEHPQEHAVIRMLATSRQDEIQALQHSIDEMHNRFKQQAQNAYTETETSTTETNTRQNDLKRIELKRKLEKIRNPEYISAPKSEEDPDTVPFTGADDEEDQNIIITKTSTNQTRLTHPHNRSKAQAASAEDDCISTKTKALKELEKQLNVRKSQLDKRTIALNRREKALKQKEEKIELALLAFIKQVKVGNHIIIHSTHPKAKTTKA